MRALPLAALAVLLAAPARAGGPALALHLDHLSAIVRDGEEVCVSLRVENPGPVERAAAVRVERTDAAGRVAERRDYPLEIPSRGHALASYSFRAEGRPGEVRWRLAGGEGWAGRARFLDEEDAWPDLAAEGFGLAAADGVRWVLRLRRRRAGEDAHWAWPRALARRLRRPPGSALLLVPEYAERAWADALRTRAPGALVREWPRAPLGTVPALDCLAHLERALASDERTGGSPGAVLVVLPAEDALRGTPPRLLGAAVEWMLARARRAGARRCVVAGPFTMSAPEKVVASLRGAAAGAARLFGARALPLEDLERAEYWRPEGATGRVYASEPNAAGRQRLAEILAGAVR